MVLQEFIAVNYYRQVVTEFAWFPAKHRNLDAATGLSGYGTAISASIATECSSVKVLRTIRRL